VDRDGVAKRTVVITGAFSYTGQYTTRTLLQRGYNVRTLTAHPHRRHEFRDALEVFPFNFESPAELARSLRGASCLINTYWIRFPKGKSTFESAVKNTIVLFKAAKAAGVERIVHVSIANPSATSKLGYYQSKVILEVALTELQVPYSILRPTVIFGIEDILINNIAWFVRRFPLFTIPGDGQYRVRPIYVGDMATLLADAVEKSGDEIMDAVGPEIFTFEELVRAIASTSGKSPTLVRVPRWAAYAGTWLVGRFVRDVILTREEYAGLMDGLLAPEGPPTGRTLLTSWLKENGRSLGLSYSSEVQRHF